jgi:hypothetical protein
MLETVNYLLNSSYVTGRILHLDGGRHLKWFSRLALKFGGVPFYSVKEALYPSPIKQKFDH